MSNICNSSLVTVCVCIQEGVSGSPKAKKLRPPKFRNSTNGKTRTHLADSHILEMMTHSEELIPPLEATPRINFSSYTPQVSWCGDFLLVVITTRFRGNAGTHQSNLILVVSRVRMLQHLQILAEILAILVILSRRLAKTECYSRLHIEISYRAVVQLVLQARLPVRAERLG